MQENENFKFREISQEAIEEYYKEKGVSLEEVKEQEKNLEKEPKNKEQEKDTEQQVSAPSFTYEGKEEEKNHEEEKKLIVKDKIKSLLKIAEEKGLQSSIKEAEKENDPFLLDIYHDVLAKDAIYKKYLKEKK